MENIFQQSNLMPEIREALKIYNKVHITEVINMTEVIVNRFYAADYDQYEDYAEAAEHIKGGLERMIEQMQNLGYVSCFTKQALVIHDFIESLDGLAKGYGHSLSLRNKEIQRLMDEP